MNGMSPRKEMASDSCHDNFGVGTFTKTGKEGDGTSAKMMKDDVRGAGKPVKHTAGKYPAQAMPDHGPHK